MNQTLELRARFAIAVRTWRCSSSAATVDARGTLHAGDRPRTVAVVATLDNGEEFSFDVRIVRAPESPNTSQPQAAPSLPAAASSPAQGWPGRSSPPPSPSSARSPREEDWLTPGHTEPAPDLVAAQSREVQRLLDQAQAATQGEQWQQADAALSAAAVAAMGNSDLQTAVRSARDRIHEAVACYCGRQCAGVVQAVRAKQFGRARELLGSIGAPTRFQTMIQRLRSLVDLIERLERSDGLEEAQFQQLLDQSRQPLDSAFGVSAYPVLGALSQVAADWQLEELVTPLLEVISSQRLPIEERKQLTQALSRMGASAFAAVIQRLAEMPADNEAGQWLLHLLADLSPGRQAGALVTCFARLGAGPRANLVIWMTRAFGSLNDMLFELLAGVLNRLPPDRRFATAVQAEIGADRLRQAALQWAVRGHKAARVVYERM